MARGAARTNADTVRSDSRVTEAARDKGRVKRPVLSISKSNGQGSQREGSDAKTLKQLGIIRRGEADAMLRPVRHVVSDGEDPRLFDGGLDPGLLIVRDERIVFHPIVQVPSSSGRTTTRRPGSR